MKKVFWIFSFSALMVSSAFSQDNNYYNDPTAVQQSNTSYDNTNSNYNNATNDPNQVYDNSVANNGDYNYNGGYNSNNNEPGTQAFADNDDVSYESFYDQLSPYGNWVTYGSYGNVWVPTDVPADFSPYATAGHWVYSDYGWTWSSDYEWGGVPFHYGRWFRDNTYGWMWMPGYEWAPAWVSWGSYDNYYCWAPLASYISYSAYYDYRPNPYCWNFVARDRFCEANLGFYLANRSFYGRDDFRGISAHINIINEHSVHGNHTYFSGPRTNDIAVATSHNITSVNIHNINHAVAPHINANQVHQQNNLNQFHNQTAYNHNTVQPNHFANNNMQTVQQHNNVIANINHTGNNAQYNRPINQNIARNNVEQQRPVQQFNRPENNISRPNNNVQYQRPAQQQHFSQPQVQTHSTQNFAAPQRSYQQSQPVQRESERSFASAQRPSSSGGGNHFNAGTAHGGRR